MRESFLPQLSRQPLVLEPDGPHDPVQRAGDLIEWAVDHVDWIEEKLVEHGALLFRGYGVLTAEEFEGFVSRVSPRALDYKRGASPRKKVRGKVYTSTETPALLPIPLHCDMSSYGKTAPAKIFFNCQIPARSLGQTPIADMQEMYDDLDLAMRAEFEARDLRLIQNVPEERSFRKRTLGAPKTWPEMFETDDRAAVEAFCRSEGIEFTWKPDGSIRLVNYTPAAVVHPRTGRKVWFNSVHNFYPTWAWELRRLKRYLPAALMGAYERAQMRRVAAEDRPNYATFGDGGEIPPESIERIRQAYWDHAVMFDWQAGDVLLLDNIRMAHGRMPYRGQRRVLASLTEPWLKPVARCLQAAASPAESPALQTAS